MPCFLFQYLDQTQKIEARYIQNYQILVCIQFLTLGMYSFGIKKKIADRILIWPFCIYTYFSFGDSKLRHFASVLCWIHHVLSPVTILDMKSGSISHTLFMALQCSTLQSFYPQSACAAQSENNRSTRPN